MSRKSNVRAIPSFRVHPFCVCANLCHYALAAACTWYTYLLVGRKTAPLAAHLHRLQRRPDRIERRAAARPALPAAREKLRRNPRRRISTGLAPEQAANPAVPSLAPD